LVLGDTSAAQVPRLVRQLLIRAIALLLAVSCLLPGTAWAQTSDCEQAASDNCPTPLSRSLGAIEAYVTAPLRWSESDWLLFGGTLAAIGVAHHFDGEVRSHFTANSPSALSSSNAHDVQDALPATGLLAGTWGFANVIDDSKGREEAGMMLESAILSVGTAYVLKYAIGREAPDQTTNPNRWGAGGSSFPSEHVTAAFAIGTVLAESGNDQYRWLRRALGYGVAGFTAYERLDHNAHWLSDTVAGAALGMATARFTMNRHLAAEQAVTLGLEPLQRGVMLTCAAHLP
jgi:PAP2 superfamily